MRKEDTDVASRDWCVDRVAARYLSGGVCFITLFQKWAKGSPYTDTKPYFASYVCQNNTVYYIKIVSPSI